MPKTKAQRLAQKRYVERHPQKIREIQSAYEKRLGYRDRAAYLRAYRLKRKLEGRPVPGGAVYQKQESDNTTES